MLFTTVLPAILLAFAATSHARPEARAAALESRQNLNVSFSGTDPDHPYAVAYSEENLDLAGAHIEGRAPRRPAGWEATPELGEGIFQWIQQGKARKTEHIRRAEWAKEYLGEMSRKWPDRNCFLFHRGQGFTWWIEDAANDFESNIVEWFDVPSGLRKSFGAVSFKSRGELKKNGAIGGWENWAFYGVYDYNDGSNVYFHKRD
ncbi:hypothetical protein Q8F55_003302 [Vanrija albida]|uniref:Uncharacterized protein n=1 Tax=Vanrija albida TaxID=181172 RepID=A0ABR3Q4E0_9TREE